MINISRILTTQLLLAVLKIENTPVSLWTLTNNLHIVIYLRPWTSSLCTHVRVLPAHTARWREKSHRPYPRLVKVGVEKTLRADKKWPRGNLPQISWIRQCEGMLHVLSHYHKSKLKATTEWRATFKHSPNELARLAWQWIKERGIIVCAYYYSVIYCLYCLHIQSKTKIVYITPFDRILLREQQEFNLESL